MIGKLAQAISKAILRGLLLMLPVVLAIGIVVWLVRTIEQQLGPLLVWLGLGALYFPGLGVILLLGVSLVLGILVRNRLLAKVVELLQAGLERIPLIGPVYRALQDLLRMVGDKDSVEATQPVSVRLPDHEIDMLGLQLPDSMARRLGAPTADKALVYLPMTYQIGGFMVAVERSRIEPMAMSSMEALQFIMAGGMGGKRQEGPHSSPDGASA